MSLNPFCMDIAKKVLSKMWLKSVYMDRLRKFSWEMWLKSIYMDCLRKILDKMWLKHGPSEKIFVGNVAQVDLHGPFEENFGQNVAQAWTVREKIWAKCGRKF